MMARIVLINTAALTVLTMLSSALAAEPSQSEAKGTLMICGGGALPESLTSRFVALAGGQTGRLVVIPTASSNVEDVHLKEHTRRWTELGVGTVSILHTRDRAEADEGAFVDPLKQATAIWFVGGQQSRLAAAYVGTATERAIHELFRRGGTIGGTSAGAAIQSRVMIQSGNPVPEITTGLDLLSGAIIDQHFLRRNRFNRLLFAVRKHPQRTGVGISEGTAVLFQNGVCHVLGDSYVTTVTANGSPAPLSINTFRSGQSFSLITPR